MCQFSFHAPWPKSRVTMMCHIVKLFEGHTNCTYLPLLSCKFQSSNAHITCTWSIKRKIFAKVSGCLVHLCLACIDQVLFQSVTIALAFFGLQLISPYALHWWKFIFKVFTSKYTCYHQGIYTSVSVCSGIHSTFLEKKITIDGLVILKKLLVSW